MPETPTILRWQGYEHEHIERGGDWFWALGIAAVCIAVTAILFHDLLFGMLILLAAVTMALYSRVPPPLTSFEISERGLRIGGTLHRYDDIISFWVEDEHPHHAPLLLVDTTKFMAPNIIIPLHDVDPASVRSLLQQHCEEVPMKEPLPHKIMELLGF